MRKLVIVCGLAAALAAPAGASADPTETDRDNAAKECKAERGTTAASKEAFRVKYGTNKNGRNAFGKCVSRTAREEEQQREDAKDEAQQECRTERGTTAESRAAFAAKYGTNKNGRNAFGKCVSQQAKANKAEDDAEDADEAEDRQNAAKQCKAERGTTDASEAAFAAKYGTNANKSNAFGKCVSQKAQEQNDEEDEEEQPAPTVTPAV